jgi:hypothetical protein
VHRSYAFSDDVFIKQYPDEIIITNAGGFPPGVSKENILTVNSRPRSKRLTEVLQRTDLIERSGQGVDKMFSLCIMESKPLPNYSNTDATQVDLRLKAKIIDGSFYLFLNKVQSERKEELNVFKLLTLNNIRQGISTGLHEASVEKLQREGFNASQFVGHNLFYIGFDLVIIMVYDLLHHVVTFVVRKLGNNGDFPVSLYFAGDHFVIDHNFGVENLLFYPFIEVVRNNLPANRWIRHIDSQRFMRIFAGQVLQHDVALSSVQA